MSAKPDQFLAICIVLRRLTEQTHIRLFDLVGPDRDTRHCHTRVFARPVEGCCYSRSNSPLHTARGRESHSAWIVTQLLFRFSIDNSNI